MTATRQQTAGEAEVFVDLVLGDDDWVRAEFDALIAACWESPCEPPPDKLCPPAGAWAARPFSRWPRRPGMKLAAVSRQQPPGRERGPPRHRSD
jgi:hypothetical protein